MLKKVKTDVETAYKEGHVVGRRLTNFPRNSNQGWLASKARVALAGEEREG